MFRKFTEKKNSKKEKERVNDQKETKTQSKRDQKWNPECEKRIQNNRSYFEILSYGGYD